MDQATELVSNNSGVLMTLVYFVGIVLVVYWVVSYIYPASDATYTKFLTGEADARKPIVLDNWKVPAIYTGGDFTFSFWMYIDDWNYKSSSTKFLFSLSPALLGNAAVSPLVGVLTPLANSLMIRAATVGKSSTPVAPAPAPGATAQPTASSVSSPDITIESNLQNLLNQQTSINMFEPGTIGTSPCDVKEVAVQRWTNITIVSSGRVLDVYMDGKLARSCVLDNVLYVPRGQLKLRLGENGGFGGRYSAIQMWNQQLTPDLIYGVYQMGPTQTRHGIFADLAKWLNINVTFTGTGGSLAQTGPPQDCNAMAGIGPGSIVGRMDSTIAMFGSQASNAYNRVGSELSADVSWMSSQVANF